MNTVDKLKFVVQRRSELSKEESVSKIMIDRKKRLTCLVDAHGIELTAAATGLAESTVLQYLRSLRPVSISARAVEEAEFILGEL